MPSYTSEQVSTLQGYINAAQTALNAGNNQAVLNALNSYLIVGPLSDSD